MESAAFPLPPSWRLGNTGNMLRYLIPSLALVLLPATTVAQEDIVLPTEMCRNYFFVPLVVSPQDGRPETEAGRTLWMLYDTGAAVTHIDPDSIARVANMDVSRINRINVTNATMGALAINRLPANVTDLDHLTVGLGREIDGILGYTVFRDFLMTLDYEAGAIRLTRGELPRPDNETVFNANGPDVRPWIRLDIDGRNRRILIDSGAAATPLAVNRLSGYELTDEPRPIGASIRFSTIEYREGGRLNGDAGMGDFVFEQPLIEEVPGTEILGGMMMRHFNWTFDQENERVRIERIEGEGPIPMDAEITHGLALRPSGLHVVIEDILPGGRGVEAGLQRGDVLTHLNGLPFAERGCRIGDGDETPTSITLTRVREGEAADVILPLVTLVD